MKRIGNSRPTCRHTLDRVTAALQLLAVAALTLLPTALPAGTCIISGDLTRTAASERVNKVALTVLDAWISSCVDWNGSLDTYPCGFLLIYR